MAKNLYNIEMNHHLKKEYENRSEGMTEEPWDFVPTFSVKKDGDHELLVYMAGFLRHSFYMFTPEDNSFQKEGEELIITWKPHPWYIRSINRIKLWLDKKTR